MQEAPKVTFCLETSSSVTEEHWEPSKPQDFIAQKKPLKGILKKPSAFFRVRDDEEEENLERRKQQGKHCPAGEEVKEASVSSRRLSFCLDNLTSTVKERELYQGREYFMYGKRLSILRPKLCPKNETGFVEAKNMHTLPSGDKRRMKVKKEGAAHAQAKERNMGSSTSIPTTQGKREWKSKQSPKPRIIREQSPSPMSSSVKSAVSCTTTNHSSIPFSTFSSSVIKQTRIPVLTQKKSGIPIPTRSLYSIPKSTSAIKQNRSLAPLTKQSRIPVPIPTRKQSHTPANTHEARERKMETYRDGKVENGKAQREEVMKAARNMKKEDRKPSRIPIATKRLYSIPKSSVNKHTCTSIPSTKQLHIPIPIKRQCTIPKSSSVNKHTCTSVPVTKH